MRTQREDSTWQIILVALGVMEVVVEVVMVFLTLHECLVGVGGYGGGETDIGPSRFVAPVLQGLSN
ncbi:hypothetical protein E2C01_043967 [Portunus trituberculatus]|uniref:Uncharacterized protein n=1 Tax=Portunus trituberculatus TaxID=210409 RepID=A0A5B7FXT3_PORTR|nr:hypothetical protein [Portunus trituberculatus]